MAEPFEAEIKKYTEALAADPKSRVFVPLSDIYRKLGRYDEAVTVAKEGILHHPNYMGGKMALARAYFENGELDLAQGLLEEILNFANDNLIANRILAQIYLQRNQREWAVPLLERLRSLAPNDDWAAQQLDQLARVETKTPEPPPPVEKTPEPMPVSGFATAPPPVEKVETTQTPTLAELYRLQGHPAEALNIYQQLRETDPTNEKITQAVQELETELGGAERRDPTRILEKILVRIAERRREVA